MSVLKKFKKNTKNLLRQKNASLKNTTNGGTVGLIVIVLQGVRVVFMVAIDVAEAAVVLEIDVALVAVLGVIGLAAAVAVAQDVKVIAEVQVAAVTRETKDTIIVHLKVKPHPKFKEIYVANLEDGATRLATKNLTPGLQVYGERLVRYDKVEYRIWDAFRSKLAGAIFKGLQNVPIEPGSKVLYLGAASGTTPSHVSDIVGDSGHVYCIEFAQRSMRDLINNVASRRGNISPFLADARMPEKYSMFISGRVDIIYCDVAQPEQAKLLADNADLLLKSGGWVMIAIKAQSIDVTMAPEAVYRMEAATLTKRGFNVLEMIDLEPYDKMHAMIVAQH
jgi:fibrillarin-like pre-rRNA processing protein